MHLCEGVGVAVYVGVGLLVCRVHVRAEACGAAIDPGAHRVVCVARVLGLQADGSGVEVAPAFTHAAALEDAEAPRVLRPTRQTVAEAVRVLVDHDTGFEGSVSPRLRPVPHVHSHSCWLAVDWSLEVGVVEACIVSVTSLVWVERVQTCAILSIQVNKVVAYTSLAIVVGLEVPCCFREAELVKQVVVRVGSVEELGDRCIDVFLPVTLLGVVRVLEVKVCLMWSRKVEVVCTIVPVALGNAIVTPCSVIGLRTIAVPSELASNWVGRVLDSDTVSFCRVIEAPWAE